MNRRRVNAPPLRARLRPVEGPRALWQSRAFAAADAAAEALPDGRFDVLGVRLRYPPDWRGRTLDRLRRFHLHYGDEILGCARIGDPPYLEAARTGLGSWIEANPPGAADAWHPYPVSTRVANWIAAVTLAPELETPAVRASLWRQVNYLARNVEDDILGNHVIRNARALVLGGAAFEDEGLLEQGVALLERELPEQVLVDGGHYERSPVYHLIVLRDLLEVASVTTAVGLIDAIERMRTFAAALARPDGAPALFNDGGLDIAPELELPRPAEGLTVFPETGYVVVRRGDLWLAFDSGPPAPVFLPAHAHADALSFQLWWRGCPVVVDPGTYTYAPGLDRDWFRGTRAHSTVAVDGRDQFDLWGAFRAGPFPNVDLLEASACEVAAAVTARGARHVRRVLVDGSAVEIVDRVEGAGTRRLESALPLAADAAVEPEVVGPLSVERERRAVAERFYERAEASAAVARGHASLPISLGWRLNLGTPA